MIIGHIPIRERLWRAIDRERAAHAYLFVGPESVGKRAVALECAERFLGEAFPAEVSVIQPERIEEKGKIREAAIGIVSVREATRALGLSSRSGSRRVLFIDDAHRLSESAQNALLKTLEEPPSGAIIFLITHEEGAMLETIRSRCERVAFSLVSEEVIGEVLTDIPEVLCRLGRPGIGFSYRENADVIVGELEILEKLRAFHLLSFGDRAALLESILPDAPRTERLLSWWAGLLEGNVIRPDLSIDRIDTIRLLGSVSATLRDIRRFPGSARIALEMLFFFRKSASSYLP